MLPKDTKARKEKAANRTSQSRLDGHLREHARLVPYSDELFNAAAQEWLIRTEQVRARATSVHIKYIQLLNEQPLQALQHPAFREMIDIAARATNGVKIYNLRNTRQAIIDTFKHNLTNLSKRLNVSTTVVVDVPHATHHLNFVGPVCERRSEPDMRHVAGKHCRRLFCRNRVVDRGEGARRVEA